MSEIYPDIHADLMPDLLRKRDAIKELIGLGYKLQPELDRVNKRIDEKLEEVDRRLDEEGQP